MVMISLIDVSVVEQEWRKTSIGSVLAQVEQIENVREYPEGFYWNFSAMNIISQRSDDWKAWDSFTGVDWDAEEYKDRIRNVDWENYQDNYGVCDNVEQILQKYPELHHDGRYFVVTLSEVRREKQPPRGGWRWHKWGEYIGDYQPQHEYLYDEEIDSVIIFHIYEKMSKP